MYHATVYWEKNFLMLSGLLVEAIKIFRIVLKITQFELVHSTGAVLYRGFLMNYPELKCSLQ